MYNKLKNFRNLSPAVKASMALLFANLVLKGLSMISGPIFTRIMSTSEYGVVIYIYVMAEFTKYNYYVKFRRRCI